VTSPTARPRTPADVLAEVAALSYGTAEETATVMGMTPDQIARALHAAGRPDIAGPFRRAARRARRAAP